MVTITDEIIEKLKSNEFSIPVKDVRDTYSTKSPVYPMITVEEIFNRPVLQIHGEEIQSRLDYRFEIYGRDISLNGVLSTKREVVTTLGIELDELMRTTYGMKRSGSTTILPYSSDGSILRYIVTYSGIIDTRTMIIYQK